MTGPRSAQCWSDERVGPVGVLSFALEVVLLVVLAVAGYRFGGPVAVRIVLAVALPVIAIAVWGRWCAPTSTHRLADPARFVLQAVIFILAGAALAAAGHPAWGSVFAVVTIAVFALTRRLA